MVPVFLKNRLAASSTTYLYICAERRSWRAALHAASLRELLHRTVPHRACTMNAYRLSQAGLSLFRTIALLFCIYNYLVLRCACARAHD